MLKTYLKTAWRSIISNKTSSIINISGLAVGMAVSFMLLLYVYNEFSFDKFHPNSDRIYQVFKNQPSNGEIRTKNILPRPLAETLLQTFPEIEIAARTSESMNAALSFGDRSTKGETIAADPTLLKVFNFDFLAGDKGIALSNPSSVIITQSIAKALFGTLNPVGKLVKYNGQSPFKVTAVIKDQPQNSSFSFKILIPWDGFMNQQPWLKEIGWDNYAFPTYIRLKTGASVATLNHKINGLIGNYFPADKEVKLFAYPFTRLHLYGNFKNGVNVGGNIEYVRLFLILAIGILCIACINFMNLSTARSQKRAKEVGIRKAIGATRLILLQQFLLESIIMAVMAFFIAIVLMIFLSPLFSQVVHIQIRIPFSNLMAWGIAVGITLMTGLLAGMYPALFLSSFKPVKILKGGPDNTNKTLDIRQVLVVIQFTFTVFLISASISIYKQLNFIANRPVGYSKSGIIEMPADGELYNKFEAFRRDAINTGAIIEGAATSEPITKLTNASWKNFWPGQLSGEDKIPIDAIGVTYHFINTYQFKLLKGRDFDISRPSDSTAVVLNESAVKLMRLKQPIGTKLKWMDVNRTVIGVVKDFVVGSPYEPVKPVIIGFVAGWATNAVLRLNPNMPVSKSLALVEGIYKKYNPNYPFEYTFTDEAFDKKFQSEKILGAMAITFTALAIFISCLGLFGLALFSAERRRKELSIRKVLGASVANLWFKLSQEFIKLVIISFFIGSAISWYYIQCWLNTYTYHADISLDIFGFTLIGSLIICLTAVSWQAIKAALVNPVKNLRSE